MCILYPEWHEAPWPCSLYGANSYSKARIERFQLFESHFSPAQVIQAKECYRIKSSSRKNPNCLLATRYSTLVLRAIMCHARLSGLRARSRKCARVLTVSRLRRCCGEFLRISLHIFLVALPAWETEGLSEKNFCATRLTWSRLLLASEAARFHPARSALRDAIEGCRIKRV